jgi:diphthine synthase
MLYLISLGLSDEKDMSVKALGRGRGCEKLYWENYTSKLNTTKEALERVFGKEIIVLDREGMEEGSEKLLEEAKSRDIGILVGGDVLSATTHLSILQEAKKKGVEYRIIHGSSVLTAVGETGLSLYKFGETVSIPFWKPSFEPKEFYETIQRNKERGLHTLVLLDTGDGEKHMTVKEGIEILEKIGPLEGSMVACSCLGGDNQKIFYGDVEVLKNKDMETPAVLIFPGELHFMEKEFLESL